MSTTSVSVIIPAYQCARTIGRVLDAVLAQSVAPKQIIVVNDHSPDDLDRAVAPYLDRIRYIVHPENRGLAQAYNTGLSEATEDYVMTLHCDCVLQPGYLEGLLELFDHPSVGAATGQYLFDDLKGLAVSDQLFLILNRIPILQDCVDQSVEPIHFVEGKADVYRHSILKQYSGFNTALRLSGEDQDISARMRRDGWKLMQHNGCRFRALYGGTSDRIHKILFKQRMYARAQSYIMLRHGRHAISSTNPNHTTRARHRLGQLASGGMLLMLAAASLWMPLAAGTALFLWTARTFYYGIIGSPLHGPARWWAALLGPVADIYYTVGAVEGLVKTVFCRST